MAPDLTQLKIKLSELITNYVIATSKQLFDSYPALNAFSWSQFETHGEPSGKKYGTYCTRFCPTINDVPGIASVEHKLQQATADFLALFPMDLLTVGFGTNCTIRIERSGTFTINYDH